MDRNCVPGLGAKTLRRLAGTSARGLPFESIIQGIGGLPGDVSGSLDVAGSCEAADCVDSPMGVTGGLFGH